jgi:alkylated DNA repair dioxygenase AlkB
MQHTKKFVNNPSDYLKKLKKLDGWKHMTWKTGRKLPRLTYRVESNDDPMMDILKPIITLIEKKNICHIEGVWGNWYRNGNDYCPDHKDDYGTDIYCLSFGGTRRVRFRNDKTNKLSYITVSSGDCYSFTTKFDATHKHSVPKTKASEYANKERISIVLFTKPKPKSKQLIAITNPYIIPINELDPQTISEIFDILYGK